MDADRRGSWLRGTLDLLVLAALVDDERYGYELAQRLEAAGLGRVKGGTLYPLLARLQAADLISASWRAGERGPGRRYYAITESGRATLRDQGTAWLEFSDAVRSLLHEQGGLT